MKNFSTSAASKSVADNVPPYGKIASTKVENAIPNTAQVNPASDAAQRRDISRKNSIVPFKVRNNAPTLQEFEIF
ncbi:MAG: hypothetical protein KA138_11975 [Saprospiraceae bacterium]|jgi:hypothetical protein|nr:hypothetical protein [Saprospiraceae bacterium]